ncbi:MAG: DUF2934 domain-containing protein [Acidobacteria bacterium]|nr:DUF2934 domain-containing protein [Acidobacteriota bacterium]
MAKKTATPRSKTTTPQADATDVVAAAPKPRAKRAAKPAASPVVAEPDTLVQPQVDETTLVSDEWEPSDEEIRVRAYHRYLERGGEHGMDFEDWIQARHELKNKR